MIAGFCVVVGIAWIVVHSRPQPLAVILDGFKTGIPKSFDDVEVQQKKWTAQYVTNAPQRVEGFDYMLAPQNATTITFIQISGFQNKDTKKFDSAWGQAGGMSSPLAKKVDRTFTRNKFTATKEGNDTAYTRDADRCLFSGDQITCYGPETLKNIAEESKPFANAYLSAHPHIAVQNMVFGPVTVKSQDGTGVISSSHEAGYDIAEATVAIDGKQSIALFYKTTSSDWRYLTEADDEYGFKCGPMQADPEARKAFYDQVCLSGTGQVKLDTSNRALP